MSGTDQIDALSKGMINKLEFPVLRFSCVIINDNNLRDQICIGTLATHFIIRCRDW